MTLQDMENYVLLLSQQPGANPGGTPTWGALGANPILGQQFVDFAINRGYSKLLDDLADLELQEVTYQFLSTPFTNYYPLPPTAPLSGVPPACRIFNRCFYQPNGLPYSVEFHAGSRMIPWEEFQVYTGQGYLIPYSYSATVPDVCAISPDRTQIGFFPGSGNAGDTITIKYAPNLTVNTDVAPLSVETSIPFFPEDCHEAIVYWAMTLVWIKLREAGESMASRKAYQDEITRIRENYLRRSRADKLTLTSIDDALMTRYWPNG